MSVTLEANRWLETHLQNDSVFYENWLWLHRRWKIQHWPTRRFNIAQKRNLLSETCAYFNWSQLPRKTEVWVRMPDRLSDIIAVLPLLKLLRKARPDFYLHLLCHKAFAPWLQRHASVDVIHTLPCRSGWGYFKHFFAIRKSFPEVWINFADSFKSDMEAYLSGTKQRFGMRKHRWRFLLNHVFKISTNPQESLTASGYKFLQAFGLKELLEPPKISRKRAKEVKAFGCIIKALPHKMNSLTNAFWKQLIASILEKFPEAHCVLWEEQKEELIDVQIRLDLPRDRVSILKEPTLLQAEAALDTLNFVITDDKDAMCLSNYLGITTFFIGDTHLCETTLQELVNAHAITLTTQNVESANSVFERIVGVV